MNLTISCILYRYGLENVAETAGIAGCLPGVCPGLTRVPPTRRSLDRQDACGVVRAPSSEPVALGEILSFLLYP